jgi:hypothetical protein
MAEEKKRYFYRCDSASVLGKQLRKLLNDCQKAERAQMEFGRRCGAESVVPVDSAFEGGVVGVVFANDASVNKTVWKEIVKDEKDGKMIWRPNCEQRQGAIVAKSEKYRPSNTATRIYGYQQVGWEMVKHLFPDGEPLGTLEKEKARYILYTELYREDTKKPLREMSKLQREAINLERQRMLLPVVTPQRVFATLQADMMADAKKGQRFRVVKPETPTFWVYNGWWYVGCAYPCMADELEEISSEAYVSKRTEILRMQRDIEAMTKNEEKGN